MKKYLGVLCLASSLWSLDQETEDLLFPKQVTRRMKYVTTGHAGQLGNQCYRIATAAGYCVEKGYFLAITPQVMAMYPEVFHKLQVVTPKRWAHKTILFEQIFQGHPKIQRSISVDGFPNSTKYFEDHKELVRDLFAPTPEIEGKLRSKFAFVFQNQNKYAALHLRTFINKEDPHVFLTHKHYYPIWATSPQYFADAMSHFEEDVTFIVCTDYVPAAKEMLEKTFPDKKFIFTDNSLVDDFYLLGMIDNVIVSNSSFSMFAAFLNGSPNQKVVMPSYCKQLEVADEAWIRVDYNYNEKEIGEEYEEWYAIGTKHAKLTGLI